jgi:hypothetical protein
VTLKTGSWLLGLVLSSSCVSQAPALRPDPSSSAPPATDLSPTFCAPQGPEICLDGRDNNCNGLFEEGCGVAQGTVQFFVAWQQPEVDIDLVVVDPSGTAAEVAAISRGGLMKDRECPGKSDSVCRGGAYENVVSVASSEPMSGKYVVTVSAEPPPAKPVHVVFAGRLGAKIIAQEFSLDAMVTERKFAWSLPDAE